MKAIVEFGIPLSALPDTAPCGVSGQIVFPNAKQAGKALAQIAHVLFKRDTGLVDANPYLIPTKKQPRITWWAMDRSAWVAVSLLDGVPRGSYAGTVKE